VSIIIANKNYNRKVKDRIIDIESEVGDHLHSPIRLILNPSQSDPKSANKAARLASQSIWGSQA